MKKLKLLLAACALFGGASLGWAQTNIISGWDGGDNTSSPSNFGWSSSTNRTLNERNAGGGVRMTTTYSGYKLEDGTEYSYSDASNPSSVMFWVRYNSSGESFTYTFQGLEPNKFYDFSGLVGWHNNSNAPTFTITLSDGTNSLATMSKSVSTKQTMYEVSSRFKTPNTMTSTADVQIVFTCNQTGDCMEAISGLSLVEVIAKDGLQNALSYATLVNTTLNNSTLTSAIATAQGVYDNASATQAQINEATSTLNAAVLTAIDGANPTDLSFVVANPGFESSEASTGNVNTSTRVDYESTGWRLVSEGGNSASAILSYGSEDNQINGATIPASDNNGNSGNALGISVGWNTTIAYQSSSPITLPVGSYVLKVNAYNAGTATLFNSKFGFVPTSGAAKLSNKTSFTLNTWETDEVNFVLTEATEGRIQIGGTATNTTSTNHGKVFFDNITLAYQKDPLDAVKKELADLVVEAKKITAIHESAIKTALSTAISTAEVFTATTAEEYVQATAALQEAMDNSNTSINHYQNDLKPIIDGLKSYATADLTAMDNDYNNGVYTSETDKAALIEQYQSIEIPALKAANATNYTSAIINPDFELDGKKVQNPTGWSHTNHGSDDGTRDGSVENMTGWYYNAYQSWWDSNVNIKQTITNLPNGQYTISATLAGWSGCTVNLTANDKWTYINGAGDGTGVDASVTCNVTDGQLDIMVNWGVRDGDNKGTFFKCDNFTLTYNGVKPMLAEVITEANAIYNNGANVGAGVFQIPTAAGTTFSNAISTAQGVYDNSGATASELQTAYDNLETAVTAFLETEINKPAEGQLFNVILTYKDYTYDQKAMTYLAGDRDDQGGYNIKYQAPANKNLAQAFTFTKVEGNNYKMSQIDADGNVRYMCTAKVYDEKGSTSSIRTTTNADDAMLITVIPTATEGVWNLKNVTADNFVGSQDAGVFTVNSHIDFNIVETTKPSIAINTTAAGYGTTMLPFAVASLPDDVKAYTCEEVDGTMLTLVEVTALAANKPYIIEGAWETNLSGDAQGTAVTCTEGLLTGVYAETTAPVGSYVLQNLSTGLGFYKVADGKQPTVMANHAYLTKNSSARVLFFDNATAIRAIEALTNGEAEIYNAAGARQKGLQKGVNIIKQGNKTYKVMVK